MTASGKEQIGKPGQAGGSSSTLQSPSSNILLGTKQLSNQILITPKLKQSLKLLFLHAFAYASCPKVKLASVSDERTVLGQVYGGQSLP